MRYYFFHFIALSLLLVALPAAATAQNQSDEYIESSSPLPGGGRVVSRSEAGRTVQTVITMPAESSAQRDIANPRSVLDAAQPTAVATSPQAAEPAQTGVAASTAAVQAPLQYPYPTQLPQQTARVAQAPGFVLHPPVRAAAVPQQPLYQIPTLGLGPAVTTRRPQGFATCNCTQQSFQRIPTAPGAAFQVQPPAATTVPSLSIQDPGQAAVIQPGAVGATPVFANPAPQFGTNQNSFWSPFVQGRGVYQPVIRLANVPPGTYLGQGIIGQPTAYVDGQPIRNLLRYISP